MKNFIKDTLILLLVLVLFGSLVGTTFSQSNSTSSQIIFLQENIESDKEINDGESSNKEESSGGNVISKIFAKISSFFTAIIKKIIEFFAITLYRIMS